jgi:UDP-glucose 4-epimerase
VRDYVHVNEVCDSLLQAIENPSNSVECLGHGVGRTVTEIVDMFKKVNSVDFTVKVGPRRKGDIESSVLEEVSPYMKNLYTIEELLKV